MPGSQGSVQARWMPAEGAASQVRFANDFVARPPDRNRIIGVNGYLVDLTAPFGGIKNSGVAREFRPAGLANYQQLKPIHLH
jgi:hypothetical protein